MQNVQRLSLASVHYYILIIIYHDGPVTNCRGKLYHTATTDGNLKKIETQFWLKFIKVHNGDGGLLDKRVDCCLLEGGEFS